MNQDTVRQTDREIVCYGAWYAGESLYMNRVTLCAALFTTGKVVED